MGEFSNCAKLKAKKTNLIYSFCLAQARFRPINFRVKGTPKGLLDLWSGLVKIFNVIQFF